jgi:hypothetical protein
MSNPVYPETICFRCRAVLGATDNYCRRCSQPTATLGVQKPKLWDSPWVILPLLFLILGPLALPLLWRNRYFTNRWKVILTVVVTGITVYVLWQCWQVTQQMLAPLLDMNKL